MASSERPRIVILGSGNVASCLAPALGADADIIQVYSRTLRHAETLAGALGAKATDDLSKLAPDADFYIIAVKDDAVGPLTDALRKLHTDASRHGIWCHTSGSSPLSALDGLGEGRCVFYPLQTFTAGDVVDPASVTMLLEGDCDATIDKARQLASSFTSRIHEADSARRKSIHLAAVFASNFANHMWAQAQGILKSEDLSLSLLEPLIEATLRKAVAIGPHEGQTGPARRGDSDIMAAHMQMLPPQKASLYKCVSDSIISDYTDNNTKAR